MNLPNTWFCIKYSDQTKVKWFRAKKGRKKASVLSYFRSKPNFKWGKVYTAKTKEFLFWFNRNEDGFTDRRTSNKITIKPNENESNNA
ncbi:structural protein [Cellulophaga phage Omtje_3]|uniref:Structural protein n=1 Tax=Cellulophaga phage Omtje_1 TaxID=2745694 RepID=A0A8E5E9E8_9VIRU|nr:structural protein [Cellulophaga phage Omtje_1]QQV90366.1 structural protein [Cellulophaga phage Omtje_2]QQV90379.1 structural protein [Cellulophaga phage Omtje_3]QQV90392.1 structural protein [Cellulophaga phage Omtje_4]QQV90405.1 structural protein [Cellulophaga phage Omtje_5]